MTQRKCRHYNKENGGEIGERPTRRNGSVSRSCKMKIIFCATVRMAHRTSRQARKYGAREQFKSHLEFSADGKRPRSHLCR